MSARAIIRARLKPRYLYHLRSRKFSYWFSCANFLGAHHSDPFDDAQGDGEERSNHDQGRRAVAAETGEDTGTHPYNGHVVEIKLNRNRAQRHSSKGNRYLLICLKIRQFRELGKDFNEDSESSNVATQ